MSLIPYWRALSQLVLTSPLATSTEEAFADMLGIKGDPYTGLLEYE